MAAFTWTLCKCNVCGLAQRTRGVHKSDSVRCLCGGTYLWVKVTWGKEKYAGDRAGTKEIRAKAGDA